MTLNLSPTEVLAAFGLLLALVMVWRSGTRRARHAAEAAYAASRVVSLAGRVLVTAGVIVGIEWVAIIYAPGSTLFWVVLAVPALISGHVLTRLLTVTSLDTTRRPETKPAMSTPHEQRGEVAAVGGPSPLYTGHAEEPGSAVVRADRVLDGELVNNDRLRDRQQHYPRVVSWWQRSPRVPAALKSRVHAVQATKDAAVAMASSPWRFVRAAGRGTVLAVRAWRRWVTVRDYREAAEQSEKLADKYLEIRALTLFRWRVTGAVAGTAAAGGAVAEILYGPPALWITAVVGAAVLAITGRRRDGSPGRKAVLAGPRSLSWTMDPQILVDAFRDAKLIGKDETLRLVERACRVGAGWAITVDLPATRKAADAVKNREALASALAVDEVQLLVERVRGTGGHAGRVAMWVADADPYGAPPLRTPLLDVQHWDAWRPVPFGRDARDRRIDLPLVWTSLLVGAIPRQGKTFAARLAAAGLILDPNTRLYVADFKAGKDWDAAAQVAHRFLSGDEPHHVLTLAAWLVELITEVQGRYRRMRELDNQTCPESKVIPAMSRDSSLNMPITGIFIDEVQVPLEERTPVDGTAADSCPPIRGSASSGRTVRRRPARTCSP